MDRQKVAALTRRSELGCVLLSVLYSALVVYDIFVGKPYWSSSGWFHEGFCIWGTADALDSHLLGFVGLLVFGGYFAVKNWILYKRHSRPALLIAAAISVFDVLHGCGHLVIHLDSGLLAAMGDLTSPLEIATKYATGFAVLMVAPFLGYSFGVSFTLCTVIHIVTVFFFIQVPPQFVFGAVQLFLNMWYCVPRLALVGCDSPEDIKRRVDHGWAFASFGICAIMAIVFAEMSACDWALRSITGHFIYDLSTIVLTGGYSMIQWRELPAQEELS